MYIKDLCDIIQRLHDNKNAFKSTDPVRFILFLLYFNIIIIIIFIIKIIINNIFINIMTGSCHLSPTKGSQFMGFFC